MLFVPNIIWAKHQPKDYFNAVTAPKKDITLIEGCGHNVQYSLPEDFAKVVK